MKKVTLIKGKLTVEVYESEVGRYKKNGWKREGEKPSNQSKKKED